MGIYDRDYYRQERRSDPFSYAPRTIVGWLIAVNVVVWIADFFTPQTFDLVGGHLVPVGRWLSDHMAVHVSTLAHPLFWWQYLTAGFAHSPLDFGHIAATCSCCSSLGASVEEAYGPKEFLRLYLVMVIFASLAWNVVNKIAGTPGIVGMYGASGAIAGVVVLFALNFPHRTILLFFVLPMPAWLFGVLAVAYDIFGAAGRSSMPNVAYSAHLAGAAFAFIYYKQRWNFTRWTEGRFQWLRLPSWLSGKPRLRVRRPEDEPEEDLDADLSREVDRILEKIGREGEASLTAKERRTLETASRQYRKKMVNRD